MPFVRKKRGQVLLVHSERVPGEGRVRQRELHRFASPAELEAVLAPGGWSAWTRALAWREQGIRFEWKRVREQLEHELSLWQTSPAGAIYRRDGKLERLAHELRDELATLSPARVADAALIERARPELADLRDVLVRLLSPARRNASNSQTEEPRMITIDPKPDHSPDALFDDGMEHWWAGDRPRALRVFRRVLAVDPHHADAHNHIGIASLDARKAKVAERHFRAAVDDGARRLERDGGQVPWSIVQNRPYLRGLGNLALALRAQGRWRESLAIHEEMLRLNPGDNQGVRYLVGEDHLRLGNYEAAVRAYGDQVDEPGCAFGLPLAKLYAVGPHADVGKDLLVAFASNRYVAPMLLGEPWERLDGFHATNMAEPEWAEDVMEAQADLWHGVPRGAQILRFWWGAPPVVAWRKKLDDFILKLKDLPPSDERSQVCSEARELRTTSAVRAVARQVRALS